MTGYGYMQVEATPEEMQNIKEWLLDNAEDWCPNVAEHFFVKHIAINPDRDVIPPPPEKFADCMLAWIESITPSHIPQRLFDGEILFHVSMWEKNDDKDEWIPPLAVFEIVFNSEVMQVPHEIVGNAPQRFQ